MFRLLLITVVVTLILWVTRGFSRPKSGDQPQEMVPDALTGVYILKNEAVTITRHGETLYFSTAENRDRYLTNNP